MDEEKGVVDHLILEQQYQEMDLPQADLRKQKSRRDREEAQWNTILTFVCTGRRTGTNDQRLTIRCAVATMLEARKNGSVPRGSRKKWKLRRNECSLKESGKETLAGV